MRLTADERSYTKLTEQMEANLATLDSTGAEIAKLLKKRQSRLFTDEDKMEAYKGITGLNHCMSGDFPMLEPRQNAVSRTGAVSSVVIQPNWRYL